MPRFFTTKEQISDTEIIISGGDAFHIAHSLRMAVGEEITVSDGEGAVYACRLTDIKDDTSETTYIPVAIHFL